MKSQPNVSNRSTAADCSVAVARDVAPKGREPYNAFPYERFSARPADTASVWNASVDCAARNALQVILSGSEILLDKGCRVSPSDQTLILERILASAHHLNCIIATLTKRDEQIGEIMMEGMNGAVLRER